MKLLPQTSSGKWAIIFSVIFIVLIFTKINGFLPMPTFSVAALGLIGFILGIRAIFNKKDKAILNYLPVLVGLVIILWTAAELIFPH